MKQVNIFDFIEDDYIPSYDISKYQVRNPSFLRAEDGTVIQVTRYMEEKIGKYILLVDIQCMLMKILQRMKN